MRNEPGFVGEEESGGQGDESIDRDDQKQSQPAVTLFDCLKHFWMIYRNPINGLNTFDNVATIRLLIMSLENRKA